MNFLNLDRVDSTNSYLARNHRDLPSPLVVTATEQEAGRGQRGNHWESEPGKNLTFSVLLRPENYPAISQFAISEAFALAVVDALRIECGVEAKVKWPNDIYVGDRKICGILIEHAVMGRNIMHTIAGAGINLNQKEFHSDAPNPVSVIQITGRLTDIDRMLNRVASEIEKGMARIVSPEGRESVHADFMRMLWRGDGKIYPYHDVASGKEFGAVITDIEPTGHLQLTTPEGERLRYAFKEVEAII